MRLFHRHKKKEAQAPEPLVVPGVADAPMTAEPTDTEVAAQALLEVIIEKQHKHKARSKQEADVEPKDILHDRKYYEQLAERIAAAYDTSRRRTQRFLSFCEQELQRRDIPAYGKGSIAILEAELYKRIDIVDREGGELKKRWQECLAEATLRLMEADEKRKVEDEKRYEEEYNEQHNQQA